MTVDWLLQQTEGVLDLLPPNMPGVTVGDAEYHASVKADWIELHQLNAPRNVGPHLKVIEEVSHGLRSDASVLELAAGVGFDAHLFFAGSRQVRCYILSEVSESLLWHARSAYPRLLDRPVRFCCLDATDMPLADRQVDAVFLIAALHHFPSPVQAVQEIDRVTTSRARVVVGMEPNRWWSQIITRARPLVRRRDRPKEHSPADEVAEGFTIADFRSLGDAVGWQLERVVPVWFFTGFVHYGLELVYRTLHLKHRIRLPARLESAVLLVDKVFFMLPFSSHLAWHYTVVYNKTA